MIYREIAFLRPIIGAETRFCPQLLSPLNVSGTLNRLNFLYRPPPVCSPARASRRAHRNGNTVVLAWGEEEEKKKGGPGDVTKSLWRNILLIHVRLYNLAHFYSERPRAQRSVEHASAVAERAARRHRVLRYRTIFRPRSPLPELYVDYPFFSI